MRSVHLTLATVGRHPIAPDEPTRRAILHLIGRMFAATLLLFCVVDDHLHVVFLTPGGDPTRLAAALLLALRGVSPAGLQAPHLEPVADRGHLLTLVRYCLQQPLHHGLLQHPGLISGTCYAELVGARAIPGLSLAISNELPRVSVEEFAVHVGLPREPLVPLSAAEVRRLGAFRLVGAAAFAAGADPALTGRAPAVVSARRVAAEARIGDDDLACALDVHEDTPRRLASREVDAPLLRAVKMRLSLEEAIGRVCERASVASMVEAVRRREIVPRAAAASGVA